MKFQTVILSALLIATSSASQVAPQGSNSLSQAGGIGNLVNGIKNRVKTGLGSIGRKPNYQSPPFNPNSGFSRRPGVVSAPKTQAIAKRSVLKTVWNVGKGLLGL